MSDLFAKLNLKNQCRLLMLKAPENFDHSDAVSPGRRIDLAADYPEPPAGLAAAESGHQASSAAAPIAPAANTAAENTAPYDFVLAFLLTRADITAFASRLDKLTAGDAVVWAAYPKGSSKRYNCDFNRDTGWEPMAAAGFRPVRQVAIDADWSALRFRRNEFVSAS